MREVCIEAKDISFSYENEKVNTLENCSFKIYKGELIYITGLSGAGKSTLLNIINGVIPRVIEGDLKGNLYINGEENLEIYERSQVIGNVFQNPRSQFFTTNTTSEMVFSMENYGYDKEYMENKLSALIKKYDAEKYMNRNIFQLSSGERQFVALLSVLIMEPSIFIFDEPSANLDYGNIMLFRKQIIDLKSKGHTVIIADHRSFYLKNIIDQVLFLNNKKVESYSGEVFFNNDIYSIRNYDLFKSEVEKGEVVTFLEPNIIFDNVSYKDVIKNISLSINDKEVTVIVGVNGCGKTTLARLMINSLKPTEGEVISKEKPLYIMQDAEFQLFSSSCLEELKITSFDSLRNNEILKKMSLWDIRNNHPQELSGGEKQRLQISIAMASNKKIFIFDEPTSGLDQKSMEKVVSVIKKLKEDSTVVIISHDYQFIEAVADRIVYLNNKTVENDFYLGGKNILELQKIFKQMEEYYEKSFKN